MQFSALILPLFVSLTRHLMHSVTHLSIDIKLEKKGEKSERGGRGPEGRWAQMAFYAFMLLLLLLSVNEEEGWQ